MNAQYGSAWTDEELTLALYLYCQIPFAQTKANNPEVRRLAQLLGRTPSSLARKLGNFGAFDPQLSQLGITGLTHYSKADRVTWDKFYQHWDWLVEESRQLLARAAIVPGTPVIDESPIIAPPSGPSERSATVLVRLYQAFFRRTVLSSYDTACCICGIDLSTLLVASHIIPWSTNIQTRADPQNGLCLCSLHDKAFDRGLMTIDSGYRIVVSPTLTSSSSGFVRLVITDFHSQSIRIPRRFAPKPEYLEWHMDQVFHSQ